MKDINRYLLNKEIIIDFNLVEFEFMVFNLLLLVFVSYFLRVSFIKVMIGGI